MGMNPLAGLLRGNSHSGKVGSLSERDVIAQLYGEPSVRKHAAPVVLETREQNGDERPRDERGRFLPRSAVERTP